MSSIILRIKNTKNKQNLHVCNLHFFFSKINNPVKFTYNSYIPRWEYYDAEILSTSLGKRARRFIKYDHYTVILFKMTTRARKNIIITKLIIVYFTF